MKYRLSKIGLMLHEEVNADFPKLPEFRLSRFNGPLWRNGIRKPAFFNASTPSATVISGVVFTDLQEPPAAKAIAMAAAAMLSGMSVVATLQNGLTTR